MLTKALRRTRRPRRTAWWYPWTAAPGSRHTLSGPERLVSAQLRCTRPQSLIGEFDVCTRNQTTLHRNRRKSPRKTHHIWRIQKARIENMLHAAKHNGHATVARAHRPFCQRPIRGAQKLVTHDNMHNPAHASLATTHASTVRQKPLYTSTWRRFVFGH